jgi:4-amino-4-deoxy-L-arabinose transferase-like glycosyltransferase
MKPLKIVWVVIFLIGLGMRSTELFHPIDTGSWRESDMSSIARNYYRNGMDFCHPQIDWGGKGPGYTESEFPVYPYLIALSFKLTGLWEPTGRIISFLFSLGTMLIFFRLSRYLFNTRTAIAVSVFFMLSPLLLTISNTIQPESMMFFFYICSAFTFIRWVESQTTMYYIFTIVFTALALLCKLTAINIGFLYLLILIIHKGWRFLLKPKVILLGFASVLPAIIWYTYSHRFYTLYGNSLGLSNEYPWVGWDFFTNPYFILGIIKQEMVHVWTYSGPLIIFLALVSTKMIKKQYLIFPACWFASAVLFYLIAARTTADSWADYYHIFSVPSISMLLGISVIEIYDKYFPLLNLKSKPLISISNLSKSRIIILSLFLFVSFYVAYSFRYLLLTNKPSAFRTASYYECKNQLSDILPEESLILVSGGTCSDGKYPLAYNASLLFYWLDRKGYNICIEEQSLENVISFKEKGAEFYIAVTKVMRQKQGFEEIMRKRFKTVLECKGLVLFKL